MFINKLLGPVAGFLLGHASAPAFAGEWVPIDTGQAGLSAITYRSEKMLPGEQATLAYNGTAISSEWSDLGNDFFPTKVNSIILQIVLTSGDEPITGFTGVTLRRELQGEDIKTFYSVGNDEDPYSFLRPSCGGYTGYTLSPLPDGTDAQCNTRCYRNYDDVASGQNVIACGSGEVRWIAISAVGTLLEHREMGVSEKALAEVYGTGISLDEIVATANFLVVHVTSQSSSDINFPIDDTFRAALWDDISWQQ